MSRALNTAYAARSSSTSSKHQLNGNHSGIATTPRARFTLPEREPAAPTAADAVTLADFIAMVEQELRFRGVAFHYGALADFAAQSGRWLKMTWTRRDGRMSLWRSPDCQRLVELVPSC
jgi:hypothetical protein